MKVPHISFIFNREKNMAFDGITTAALVKELNAELEGGSITRIIQPEKDELMLSIKKDRAQKQLLISANASLPLVYLTEQKKEAPLTAPVFSMLLRKHLQGGQILSVSQPSLERIIIFSISHFDEMGDLREMKLIAELMGKYSNIILTDEENRILDSIRRVNSSMSSLREVLPGKDWYIPGELQKEDPLQQDEVQFGEKLSGTKGPLSKALPRTFAGFSTSFAEELLYEAGIDSRKSAEELTMEETAVLGAAFSGVMCKIRKGEFCPEIIFRNGEPYEFTCLPYRMFESDAYEKKVCDSVSAMLKDYYGGKERLSRIRQKSADLRHAARGAYERIARKLDLQKKQYADTEKREQFRIRGEMLNTYGYELKGGEKELRCINYYDNEEIVVPLDPMLSASENARKNFERYNKLKRTAVSLEGQIEETEADRDQLLGILNALDHAETEEDLNEIRREMSDYGFIRRKSESRKGKKRIPKSSPLSFRSSDGFEILVGRNNYQNEELSFKIASGNDWWFHAKGIPGSHVIIRSGDRDVPDRTFEEAAALAAYYSAGSDAEKTEVDYTKRRNLKKKNGGKPGFVIYHSNYSMMAVPDISGIRREN